MKIKSKKPRRLIFILALILLVTGYVERSSIKDYLYTVQQHSLPEEIKLENTNNNKNEKDAPYKTNTVNKLIVKALATEINLAVPFTSQAPFAEWDEIHEETCEEASELMVNAYFNNKTLTPESTDTALLALNEWEAKNIGEYMNTNVAQVTTVLTEYFKFKDVSTVTVTSEQQFLETIIEALNSNKIIIMPAAGRMLGNPNFTAPGPLYHMLVIKGYTKDHNIITNDPGTRRGHNYVYTLSTLFYALHDWNNGDPEHGKKEIVIVGA